MPASVSNERIVDRQASSVNSVPSRRSSTRSLGSVGGVSVWMSAQQRSNRVVRSSDGTFSVVSSAVQRADTNRTNCKSGIPEFWISNDGMAEHYRWRPARSQRAQCSQIGRASCRERVEISVVGVSLKKKTGETALGGGEEICGGLKGEEVLANRRGE